MKNYRIDIDIRANQSTPGANKILQKQKLELGGHVIRRSELLGWLWVWQLKEEDQWVDFSRDGWMDGVRKDL